MEFENHLDAPRLPFSLLTPHCWNFERALGATLSTPAHFWCHALSPLLEHSSMLLMLPSWLPLGTFQHALFATLWAFSWNIPAGFASSLPLLFRDLRTLGSAIVCYDWLDHGGSATKMIHYAICVPVLSPFSHFLTLGFSRAFSQYRLIRFSVPFHFVSLFGLFRFPNFRVFAHF